MFEFKRLEDELQKQLSLHVPEFYRIVDVDTHKVFDYRHGQLIETNQKCYQVWNMNAPCMNCTSCRAIKENKPMIKLCFLDKRIFLIHSIPIEIKKRRYSIELIQDVSNSFLLQENNLRNADEVMSLISLFDERIMKDNSTNLFNKQYLLENLPSMMAHAKSESKPLSLAVLDIDRFKHVNDRFGHVFGDEVILKIADTLKALMNESIHSVRVGGDEFAVIFENIDPSAAMAICDKAACSLASFHFESHPEYSISISHGVAVLYKNDTAESFLDRADHMMYAMKKKKLCELCDK
ncbi:GGDEF domain-containing protein [Anaerotruncus rubiinfantis]|uniref:GGDEF domain-containing protein n=1 Tax=Anaerotruncus rubiinfantis TaxID=1720200 RepID=UPI000832454A|nr:GGDEF domain-containing protein [Anaerotruncus rubiinfantis]